MMNLLGMVLLSLSLPFGGTSYFSIRNALYVSERGSSMGASFYLEVGHTLVEGQTGDLYVFSSALADWYQGG